jgi:uncharacterized peroxidase-related enzyme
MGVTDPAAADRLVAAVAQDWRRAPLSAADRALCAFAETMTRAAHDMTEGDVDGLRARGFGDRAVHDASQVVALFNSINRFADALGVDPEDEGFVKPWERLPVG